MFSVTFYEIISNFVGFLLLFMVNMVCRLRRKFCQNMLGLLKLKSGVKNCPARKSRKREDNDDSRIQTAPHQTPKMSGKKRANQRTLSAIHLSNKETFYYSLS
jgi:hypothetical protein